MNVQQVYNIARREYLARVRNKWFVIGTLFVPLIMLASFSIPALLQRADVEELRVLIVDAGTGEGEAVREALGDVEAFTLTIEGVRTTTADELPEVRENLRRQVLDEELDGYLLLEPDEDLGIRGRYLARSTGNIIILQTLENRIRRVALENYLSGSGLETARVNALVSWDLEASQLSEEGEEEGGFERAYLTTFIFTMIMYITVLMAGQQMGQSIIEEKSSRLIELVLGAVTATEFIAGKIAGVLGAALTQLALWIGLAFLIGLYVLPMLAIGASSGGIDVMEFLDLQTLFYFAILFMLGYVFYSVLYALGASTCSTAEDFQQIAFPLMMPVLVSFFFVFYVITNPATTLAQVVSFVPFATPLVMLARIIVLTPPAWEIWLSILLMLAATVGAVWLSAKVFRFSLLMSGKRPSLGTVMRLLRAA